MSSLLLTIFIHDGEGRALQVSRHAYGYGSNSALRAGGHPKAILSID
jgi:hypothetical protein